MKKLETLFGKSAKEYGDLYQTHLFEQYKLFVSTALEISERREKSNVFFITTNTALITVITFFFSDMKDFILWAVIISLAGIILCYYWRKLINSYKQLNSGKFKVIHEIEQQLPLKLFDYEWVILGEGKDEKLYKPLTHVERIVPVVFGVIYLLLAIISLIYNFYS